MLRRLIVLVVAIVAIVVLAISWLGVYQVPVLSGVFGMDHARDLGTQSDRAAFEAFTDRWGIERPSDHANYTLSSKHHFSGSVQIDGTLSEAALGSMREINLPNSHFRDISFRIHDGYVELAAFVTVPGYPLSGPVYGKFSLTKASAHSVALDISQLDFGRLGVPGGITSDVQSRIQSYLNDKIVEAGITIDTLQLHEGEIQFKGTWPKTITADVPNSNDVP